MRGDITLIEGTFDNHEPLHINNMERLWGYTLPKR